MRQLIDFPMPKNFYKKNKKISQILTITILAILFFPFQSNASIIDTIKDKIKNRAEDIKQLEQDIKKYTENLNETKAEKQTLQKDISELTNTKKKLDTNIKTTEKDISKTTSNILTLQEEIDDKEERIALLARSLSSSFENLHQEESRDPIEIMLSDSNGLAGLGELIETSDKFHGSISDTRNELKDLRESLKSKKLEAEGKKKTLTNLKNELSGQKKSVVETENQKTQLLSVTKNKESNYQKILEEKMRLREEFEKELFDLESSLKVAIDPSKYPEANRNVLSWPLQNVYITQQFGATVAAKRLYVSGSHNGIDLRASDGTKVMSALSGSVEATGNTDIIKGCYSYGKWILIKHPNGLSTIYGHLSSIAVSAGDTVSTGDTIGYSGRTGYVTGPHLHLSLAASQGVKVMAIPYSKSKSCGGAVIPIADPSAFLDPIQYLPRQ